MINERGLDPLYTWEVDLSFLSGQFQCSEWTSLDSEVFKSNSDYGWGPSKTLCIF